jgi:succinate dehydrogenase / fumarate reductase flavoprotein subunit
MATELPGLFAAGEAVGGANGANRLSGNAITEALVFGRRSGRSAAARARAARGQAFRPQAARAALALLAARGAPSKINTAAMVSDLQRVMADDVGPFRTEAKLARALAAIAGMQHALGERPAAAAIPFDLARLEWLDLRNMLTVARAVALAARARTESRGAHQREDFPGMLSEWRLNQVVRLDGGAPTLVPVPAPAPAAAQ